MLTCEYDIRQSDVSTLIRAPQPYTVWLAELPVLQHAQFDFWVESQQRAQLTPHMRGSCPDCSTRRGREICTELIAASAKEQRVCAVLLLADNLAVCLL